MYHLFRTLFKALLTLFSVVILIFILFQWFGNPEKSIIGQTGDAKTIQQIRHSFHLDEPVWKRCVRYLNDLSPISVYSKSEIEEKKINGLFWGGEKKWGIKWPYLGSSFLTKKKVSTLLMEVFPATLLLASIAMLIALVFGISMGILCGYYKDRLWDRIFTIVSTLGISAPSFFMALLIAYIFGFVLHAYTGLDITGSMYELNELTGKRDINWSHLILPAVTLGIRPMSVVTQLTRTTLIDVMQQDYIRTARAKGCSEKQVVFKHAFPNIIGPVIVTMTGWFAELLAGAFFVEYIFGWNGMGRVTVNALDKMDFPVVMGAVLFSASIFIFINFITDVLIRRVDSRIVAS